MITRRSDSLLARRMRARGDLVIGSSMRDLRRAGVRVRPRLTGAPAGDFASIVWTTGYRRDHSWIDVPGDRVADRAAQSRTAGATSSSSISHSSSR